MRRVATASAALATCLLLGCGIGDPECSLGEYFTLVSGTYRAAEVEMVGDTAVLREWLPADLAEDLTVTLSDDRTEVVVRYRLDGKLVEDRWRVSAIAP